MSGVHISPEIAAVRRLHGALYGPGFNTRPIRQQIALQADNVLATHGRGDADCAVHLTCWLPATIGWSDQRILARPLTLAEARSALAREYGFPDWAAIDALGVLTPDPDFEAAVDAVVAGDLDALAAHLRARPQLAQMASRYGHRARLLHYVAANGVETYRQTTPHNAADVARLLFQAGADVNAEAGMYGGGQRVLGLLMSSAHPERAGVRDAVAAVLVAAGAR